MAPDEFTLAADLELALRMADSADAITMARFGSADLKVETKPDLTPVTEADRAVEQRMRAILAQEHPGDSIIGEEYGGGDESIPTDRTWVIDPIDATKNYVRRVPIWATLICLLVDAEPILSVVAAPALGRRWWAVKGGGAWGGSVSLPPSRLATSSVRTLSDASFSFSDEAGWEQRRATAGFRALVDGCWRSRAYGDFYSHLLVAEGAVDVAAEPALSVWDIAALIPIVREAGGTITGYAGEDPLHAGCAVTTNTLLHDQVLRLLSD